MNNGFEYMKEAMTTDLAELLSKDYNISIIESLDTLYSSETFSKLSDPNTGLYFQSSLYVYSILKNELTIGKMG